jgi:hypothetical protein
LGFGSIFTRLYALFSVGVLVASIPFAAGTRNWVRYAVLTADGLHLRVYGSGPLRELFKVSETFRGLPNVVNDPFSISTAAQATAIKVR